MFEGGYCLSVRAVNDLVFLGQEPIPELPSRFTWFLDNIAQVGGVRWLDISALEVRSECILELFPAPDGILGETV